MSSEPIALEMGHWYARDGKPAYVTLAKDGSERPTTLRDARKLGLLPSVTEIIKVAAKPALEVWKQTQVMLAALTLPRRDGETDEALCTRIITDSKEQARKAADRGSELHTSLELYCQRRPYNPAHQPYVEAVVSELLMHGIDLLIGNAERSFAHPLGYGGKVDWHYRLDGIVLDFKSKARIEPDKRLAWDEHAMQLAAYGNGLLIPAPVGVNVFVGLDDAQVYVHKWDRDDMAVAWEKFKLLLRYWQLSKGFDTSWETK